jgi:hypothetical protein
MPGANRQSLVFGLGRNRRTGQTQPFIERLINSILNRTEAELHGQTYSVYQIAVYNCFGLKNARSAIWRLDADGTENALRTLKYGVVPLGFHESHPAPPLVTGECYAVSVDGAGFLATTEFRILNDGPVAELSEKAQLALGRDAFRREVAFGDSAVAMCTAAYSKAHTYNEWIRVNALAYHDPRGEFADLHCGFLQSPEGGGLALRSPPPAS